MKLIHKQTMLLAVVFFVLNLMACDNDIETLFTLLYFLIFSFCVIAAVVIIVGALLIVYGIKAIVYHYCRWKEKSSLLRQKAEYTDALSALKWDMLRHSAPDDDREIIEQHLADIDARLAELSKRKV